MTKSVVCPRCGHIIETEKNKFTTLRVSKEFIDKLKEEQIDATYEATLRRLLGWKVNDQ